MTTQRQCHGVTRKGDRCQRRGSDFFCHQHKDQEVQWGEHFGGGRVIPSSKASDLVNLPRYGVDLKGIFPDYSNMLKGVVPDYAAMLKGIMPDYGAIVRTHLPILNVVSSVRAALAPLHHVSMSDGFNKQLMDIVSAPNSVVARHMTDAFNSLNARTVIASLTPAFDTLRQLHESGVLGEAFSTTDAEEIEETQERIAEIVSTELPKNLARRLAADAKVTTHALMVCCVAFLVLVATNPGVQGVAAAYLGYLMTALDKRVKEVDSADDV